MQRHFAFQISLDNHLTTPPSHCRISSNAEQKKLQMHTGIYRTGMPWGSHILTVEELGSEENNMGFDRISVFGSFVS